MTWYRRITIIAATGLALTVGACGDDSGDGDGGSPEDTLKALAKAVNDSDTATIDSLLCKAVRGESMSLADAKKAAIEADPALKDLRYKAQAGDVSNKTDDSATGVLVVSVEGIPATLTPEGQQFLDVSQAPRPINLIGEQQQVRLVVEDGKWVACET